MVEENSKAKASSSSLRDILSVMEERSHLGLDDELAHNLRRILNRRIARAESGAYRAPGSFVLVEEETEVGV
ncbi:MAG TPA: hypothetical protein VGL22_00470 [Terracidiphilus sp.]|jgi:hypothetical protein